MAFKRAAAAKGLSAKVYLTSPTEPTKNEHFKSQDAAAPKKVRDLETIRRILDLATVYERTLSQIPQGALVGGFLSIATLPDVAGNGSKLEWVDRNSCLAIRSLLDGEINFL